MGFTHIAPATWMDPEWMLQTIHLQKVDILAEDWECKQPSKAERYNELLKLVETWINGDEEE